MLDIDNTAFVLIDVQGKLAEVVHEKQSLYANLSKLIRGMQALKIPIIWTEQVPEKTGRTIPEISDLLEPARPISKLTFSCCENEVFMAFLKTLDREQILLAGIETHVCIYQTATELVDMHYEVEVVADAVSSRTASNKAIGLEKIKACGAALTSTETALFELTRTATHPAFREILALVK